MRGDRERLVEGCRKTTASAAFDLLGYKVLAHLELMFYVQSRPSEIKDFTLMSQLTWSQAAKCLGKRQDKNAMRTGSLVHKKKFSVIPLSFPKESSKPAGAPR